MMITKNGTIRANHPIREKFSSCSTGNHNKFGYIGYYKTKGHAIIVFDDTLREYDLCLDPDDLSDFYGNDGRKTIAVHDKDHNTVSYAVLLWHRMDYSGQYEFIGYLT